ncbi:phosphoribosyltransferase [Microvirga thermotolerans]|uniref:Phosphoribosyltransferase n=1 Tax=Microvirga thermotolerans TaxID=2651334 RepID=A0A5P9JYB8_9HYPH|nr:phosphoribosyltransferase family protein [Microvirga thermotolerans]QFU16748.1 phosphoribosyltransferase [Microvirga thermotolerans]
MDSARFRDRDDAGAQLASRLAGMNLADPVVLALPRGGVPVARPIAKALDAPLDLLLVRKIGVPSQPELAAAAIVDGEHPEIVFNRDVMSLVGLSDDAIDDLAQPELWELERRRRVYLKDRKPVPVEGRTAIVVDDGIATGTTVRAALAALRRRNPASLVLAVPVAPDETVAALRPLVDDLVCLSIPRDFYAISPFYEEFHQLTDAEVTRMLEPA